MVHGKQDVQTSFTLGRTWSRLPEDMSQRGILQRTYGYNQWWITNRKFKLLEEGEARISEDPATIQAIGKQLNQIEHTIISSGSQEVNQPDYPVASNHSGTSRLVAKSHHYSQYEVVSRIRQGLKGQNKTFSTSNRESDPIIQKLLDLVKEVHKSQK
ncbi:hypothetical protein O181_033284 [Austropuccinia psidii MF-1]|uniref:Uncharacterized protein n=1 Tax=Austropuccinia psidii MF-1 TaxID=1389203 RepID=A0A9Q3H8E0_9BASI|nr:hypothetical protein [Austropuccinia psidii MF-1]